MASERPTRILLSKSDLSREEIEKLSDGEAWELIYSIKPKRVRDTRPQICFTGFGSSKKQELADIAGHASMKVVSSVTQNLRYLCGDENSGPKKREKAAALGAVFLSEEQFLNMLETGEVPGNSDT